MEIRFSKYHGLGNDFLIVDARDGADYQDLAKKICDRRFGVGADGLIVYRPPREMLFFNADGSKGTMCGNGLRCLARYLHEEKRFGRDLIIDTPDGPKGARVGKDLIETDLGVPDFSGKRAGVVGAPEVFIDRELEGFKVSAVYTGAAHLIVPVPDPRRVATEKAAALSNHALFPDRVNVNFTTLIDRSTAFARVFERGVGWTEACGTGAAAVYAVFRRKGLIDDTLSVRFNAGAVAVTAAGERILLSGPAEKIAEGIYWIK